MAQARCSNGHIYDSDIYGDNCPYCEHGANTIDFEGADSAGGGDFGLEDVGKSFPVSAITPEEVQKTRPPKQFLEQQEEIGKTKPAFTPKKGGDPIVGWLVCVDGHDVGLDYKLSARTNTIGRGSEMDVRIKGDDTITSNVHAKIDYDVLNNDFYLVPANNRNTIYHNGAPVYAAQKLEAYDRIRLGQSEVLFVPFCCDKFVWPVEEAAAE